MKLAIIAFLFFAQLFCVINLPLPHFDTACKSLADCQGQGQCCYNQQCAACRCKLNGKNTCPKGQFCVRNDPKSTLNGLCSEGSLNPIPPAPITPRPPGSLFGKCLVKNGVKSCHKGFCCSNGANPTCQFCPFAPGSLLGACLVKNGVKSCDKGLFCSEASTCIPL